MDIKKRWCLYLVQCLDGSFYCGISNDVNSRMLAHREGRGSKYVRAKGFMKLVKVRECIDKSQALRLEFEVKSLKRAEKMNWKGWSSLK